MRRPVTVAALAVVVAACAPANIGPPSPPSSMASPPAPTSSSTAPASASSTATSAVDVALMGAVGGGAGGNPLSTVRLRAGQEYRFAELLPVLSFEAPTDHWEVRGYDDNAVRLRWRGESGAHPGTLVLVVFAGRTDTVESVWTELEAGLDEDLEKVGATLEWVATGAAAVGVSDAVEWREMRTGSERPVEFASSPCVVTLFDRECVWFESGARLLVVPVGDFAVPVLVTEQMCDCDLGGLGRLRRDNEIGEHEELIATALASLTFDH